MAANAESTETKPTPPLADPTPEPKLGDPTELKGNTSVPPGDKKDEGKPEGKPADAGKDPAKTPEEKRLEAELADANRRATEAAEKLESQKKAHQADIAAINRRTVEEADRAARATAGAARTSDENLRLTTALQRADAEKAAATAKAAAAEKAAADAKLAADAKTAALQQAEKDKAAALKAATDEKAASDAKAAAAAKAATDAEARRTKKVAWGIGIAAVVLLVAGLFIGSKFLCGKPAAGVAAGADKAPATAAAPTLDQSVLEAAIAKALADRAAIEKAAADKAAADKATFDAAVAKAIADRAAGKPASLGAAGATNNEDVTMMGGILVTNASQLATAFKGYGNFAIRDSSNINMIVSSPNAAGGVQNIGGTVNFHSDAHTVSWPTNMPPTKTWRIPEDLSPDALREGSWRQRMGPGEYHRFVVSPDYQFYVQPEVQTYQTLDVAAYIQTPYARYVNYYDYQRDCGTGQNIVSREFCVRPSMGIHNSVEMSCKVLPTPGGIHDRIMSTFGGGRGGRGR